MNPAEVATTLIIEETLGESPAFRKVEERLYVVKQGSAYVMVNVVPWGKEKAMIRCVAQLVRGINMTKELAMQLLGLNAHLRFGAFAYDPVDSVVLFIHSILGGHTLDPEELLTTLSDVALIADEYDDQLADKYGGQRMQDVLEDAALERILDADPNSFSFDDDESASE